MCGRYGRRSDKQRIAEWMQTQNTNVFDDESPFAPSFNVAPQTFQPVVRLDRETGERELAIMRWGLVPYWAEGQQSGVQHDQCKSGDRRHQPCVPRCDETAPLPCACGLVL